jgi:enoyl-CoA hydratase/carnithine racemase
VAEVVRLERGDDGVAIVTLDRPPMNAIDESVVRGLVAVTEELVAATDDIRAVLVRSAVDGVFMAGADLTTIAGLDEAQVETIVGVQQAFTDFAELPQPTVAAISGHALGGGCELALACDFRFMARNHGLIGQPEVRLGLIPGAGGTQRLTRLIGPGKAASYLLKGLQVGADDAERDGLVHFAVDEDELEQRAADFAASLARQAPIALRAIKRAIRAAGDPDGFAVERQGFHEVLVSEDAQVGVAAFFAGDKPRFAGR